MDDYQVYYIPKKSGGRRRIEAPNDELKAAQRADALWLSYRLRVSPFAHAFRPGHNIVTMAQPHVGRRYVLSMDLRNFFPSITEQRFLAFLCDHRSRWEELYGGKDKVPEDMTEQMHERLQKHFYDFGDGRGSRLPQGAPCSPLLANVMLYRLDWRLAWIAYNKELHYSRYADDLVFSGEDRKAIWHVFYITRAMLGSDKYRLQVHPRKIRLMSYATRQKVCGIVVNEKINLPREWRRRLRAAEHQNRLYLAGLQDERPKDHGLQLAGKQALLKMVENTPVRRGNREYCGTREMIRNL